MNDNTKGAPVGTPNTTEYKVTENLPKPQEESWRMKKETVTINGITYDLPETKRNAFTFFRSFLDAVEGDEDATDTQKLALLLAVVRYALDFEEPDQQTFSNMGRYVWKIIVPNITSGMIPFLNGSKGAKFGKLGGAPKGNQNARKNNPETTPKTTPNKNMNKNKNKNKDDKERLTIVSPKKARLSLNAPTDEFSKFNAKLKEQCPHVAKLETQMSETELKKLVNKYGVDSVWRILHKMDNRKDLTKKNRNVYRTALNWFEREPQKGGQQ